MFLSFRLLKGFIIGISYSASIGGCGSLVGIYEFLFSYLDFYLFILKITNAKYFNHLKVQRQI